MREPDKRFSALLSRSVLSAYRVSQRDSLGSGAFMEYVVVVIWHQESKMRYSPVTPVANGAKPTRRLRAYLK